MSSVEKPFRVAKSGRVMVMRENMENKKRLLRYLFLGAMLVFALGFAAPRASAASAGEKTALNTLTKDMDISPAAACGIMANIYAESGFTSNLWAGGGYYYGLCMWSSFRITRLQNFCANHNYNYTSLEGQLHFINYETRTYFPDLYRYLKNLGNTQYDAAKAAYQFVAVYELPNNVDYHGKMRAGYAVTYFNSLAGGALYLNASQAPGGIKLTWTGKSSYGYQIRRAEKMNGPYTTLANVGAGTKSYSDKTVSSGKKYYYFVWTLDSSGSRSVKSNSKSIAYAEKKYLTDSKCSVKLNKTSFTYSGKAVRPKVTVTYKGAALKNGKDYSVSFKNNVNAGTALAVITGRGNCEGSRTVKFTIAKASQKIKSSSSITVTTNYSKIKVKASAKGKISLTSANKAVARPSGTTLYLTGCGQTVITVKAGATRNYRSATRKIPLTVKPAGPAIKKVTAKNGAKALVFWSGKAQAWQIQWSKSPKFANASSVTASGNKRQLLLSRLTGEKVYIRIRGYVNVSGRKVYSPWSRVKSVSVRK